MSSIVWDDKTKEIFDLLMSKIPSIHRDMAESMASSKSEEMARDRNSSVVQEQDVAKAMFTGVPSLFKPLMIKIMDDCQFDYRKHGFGG